MRADMVFRCLPRASARWEGRIKGNPRVGPEYRGPTSVYFITVVRLDQGMFNRAGVNIEAQTARVERQAAFMNPIRAGPDRPPRPPPPPPPPMLDEVSDGGTVLSVSRSGLRGGAAGRCGIFQGENSGAGPWCWMAQARRSS